MVARILSGTSIRGLLNYNEKKVETGNATLILANRFGVEIEQLDKRAKLTRFEHLTLLNSKVKTNSMHIMLNFDRSDRLNNEHLQKIATVYMDKIGFGEQPFLVYNHQDASHPHVHIITTNIKSDGRRIDIHNIGKHLSETARKEIEIQFGLVHAEGRSLNKNAEIKAAQINEVTYARQPTRSAIYNVVTTVSRDYRFASFAEYNAVLREFNVTADRGKEDSVMFQKRGLVYSLLDQNGKRIGIPIKASALAGKPTLDRIEKKFPRNLMYRKPFRDLLASEIDQVFGMYHTLSKEKLVDELKAKSISLIFRQNEKGLIYGATYIDHKNRVVFNGSDLGKPFSAKGILERLGSVDQLKPGQKQRSTLKPKEQTSYLNPLPTGDHANKRGYLDMLMEIPKENIDTGQMGNRRKKKKKQKGRSQEQGNQI